MFISGKLLMFLSVFAKDLQKKIRKNQTKFFNS